MSKAKTKITCAELLEFVPDNLLEKIEKETKVNYQVKKLNGKIMFKLLLMSLLDSKNISLRVMEEIYNSPRFTTLSAKRESNKTKHSISNLIRELNDYKVYEINNKKKHWLNITVEEFEKRGYSWDEVYIINEEELGWYEERN